MIVHLNNNTYRVQFIKEVEDRKRGRTTITTICKIFKFEGEQIQEDGSSKKLWREISAGAARQNPSDKYNHMIGKRVALRHAMIKELSEVQQLEVSNEVIVTLGEICEVPKTLYHFDRVERSVFANKLVEEFGQGD